MAIDRVMPEIVGPPSATAEIDGDRNLGPPPVGDHRCFVMARYDDAIVRHPGAADASERSHRTQRSQCPLLAPSP